jgi:hypothetical protein
MSISDEDKIAHDALLRELHNIDGIVEKHAELIIATSGALIAFAAT